MGRGCPRDGRRADRSFRIYLVPLDDGANPIEENSAYHRFGLLV
ncbi:MAG: hypothetical protein R2843_15870 [Thermomicrobiales bacterium]